MKQCMSSWLEARDTRTLENIYGELKLEGKLILIGDNFKIHAFNPFEELQLILFCISSSFIGKFKERSPLGAQGCTFTDGC